MIRELMNRIGRLFRQQGMIQSGTANPADWLVEHVGGGSRSLTGGTVTPSSALGLPAVWSSVNLIAGHIGMTPIEYRKKTPSGSEVVTRHAIHKLLNVQPNELQTAFTFKQTLMANALLQGNGRAVIMRDQLGVPNELIIMFPQSTFVLMEEGVKYHVVWFDRRYLNQQLPYNPAPSSFAGGQSALYRIPDRDVLHIPGLSYNGLWGLSLVDVAKNIFGLDQAGIETASTMFRNNGKPSLILQAPPGALPTQKEAEEFLAAFRNAHEGIDNTARTGLLREGIEANALPINASDAQYLDSRKFSREDLALLMGTEYLLGESSSVYRDLQERQTAYVTNTLGKWLQIWEEQVWSKMTSFNVKESDSHYIKANASVLMKGSPNSLADYTGKLRVQGALSGNEVRDMHGFNTVPDEELETYGNPAITTGTESSESETESTQMEGNEVRTPSTDEEPEQRALRHVFRQLIKYERRRILEMAGKPRFIEKAETFYWKFSDELVRACVECGLPKELAADHIKQSQDRITDVIGVTDEANHADELDRLTKDWEQRAEEFTHVTC